ncbi:MAG: hypothetical protein JO322_11035 [Candidatus Eremiobacteraeota bacterium]|nr:hypothetical protein [Candidatus Eremiobacteraeota bacterium]
MNALLLAAYRVSLKAAENVAVVRTDSRVELQMRNSNGDLFQRVQLT